MAGRPTKYHEGMPDLVDEYTESCGYELYPLTKSTNANGESVEYKTKAKIPTIAGLSLFLGVTKSTIQLWQEEYPLFSASVRQMLAKQEEIFVEGGASGDLNATISKLVLHNHGYSDKQEVSGKDGAPLTVVFDSAFKKEG